MRIVCITVLVTLGVTVPVTGLPARGANAMPASNCTAKTVRSALSSFIPNYDRGDYAALDAQFAAEPDFQWYSTNGPGERLGRQAKQRSTLISYFEARHAKRDRLAWRSFQFNGNSPRYGNFQFLMWRQLPGFNLGERFPVSGKGAAICSQESTRFIVLTFGVPPIRNGR